MSTIEKFDDNVMHTYGRFGVVLDKGEKRTCIDENGKSYIDFGSGIGCNSLGFCDEEWADAVCSQVRSIQHTSNYYTAASAKFYPEGTTVFKKGNSIPIRVNPKNYRSFVPEENGSTAEKILFSCGTFMIIAFCIMYFRYY